MQSRSNAYPTSTYFQFPVDGMFVKSAADASLKNSPQNQPPLLKCKVIAPGSNDLNSTLASLQSGGTYNKADGSYRLKSHELEGNYPAVTFGRGGQLNGSKLTSQSVSPKAGPSKRRQRSPQPLSSRFNQIPSQVYPDRGHQVSPQSANRSGGQITPQIVYPAIPRPSSCVTPLPPAWTAADSQPVKVETPRKQKKNLSQQKNVLTGSRVRSGKSIPVNEVPDLIGLEDSYDQCEAPPVQRSVPQQPKSDSFFTQNALKNQIQPFKKDIPDCRESLHDSRTGKQPPLLTSRFKPLKPNQSVDRGEMVKPEKQLEEELLHTYQNAYLTLPPFKPELPGDISNWTYDEDTCENENSPIPSPLPPSSDGGNAVNSRMVSSAPYFSPQDRQSSNYVSRNWSLPSKTSQTSANQPSRINRKRRNKSFGCKVNMSYRIRNRSKSKSFGRTETRSLSKTLPTNFRENDECQRNGQRPRSLAGKEIISSPKNLPMRYWTNPEKYLTNLNQGDSYGPACSRRQGSSFQYNVNEDEDNSLDWDFWTENLYDSGHSGGSLYAHSIDTVNITPRSLHCYRNSTMYSNNEGQQFGSPEISSPTDMFNKYSAVYGKDISGIQNPDECQMKPFTWKNGGNLLASAKEKHPKLDQTYCKTAADRMINQHNSNVMKFGEEEMNCEGGEAEAANSIQVDIIEEVNQSDQLVEIIGYVGCTGKINDGSKNTKICEQESEEPTKEESKAVVKSPQE